MVAPGREFGTPGEEDFAIESQVVGTGGVAGVGENSAMWIDGEGTARINIFRIGAGAIHSDDAGLVFDGSGA